VAYEVPGFKIPALLAAADLRTHQYKLVNLNASGQVALAGSGTRAIGVLQNKPNTGEVCEIIHDGISKVVLGATVTAGDEVMSDASARAITGTATNQGLGVALEGGAVNTLGTILLDRRGTI
jgi:hypothetical protein